MAGVPKHRPLHVSTQHSSGAYEMPRLQVVRSFVEHADSSIKVLAAIKLLCGTESDVSKRMAECNGKLNSIRTIMSDFEAPNRPTPILDTILRQRFEELDISERRLKKLESALTKDSRPGPSSKTPDVPKVLRDVARDLGDLQFALQNIVNQLKSPDIIQPVSRAVAETESQDVAKKEDEEDIVCIDATVQSSWDKPKVVMLSVDPDTLKPRARMNMRGAGSAYRVNAAARSFWLDGETSSDSEFDSDSDLDSI